MTAIAAVFVVLLVLAVGWGVGRDWCERIADHRDRISDQADHQRAFRNEIARHAAAQHQEDTR